jgi:hypothetical protein
MNYIKLKKAPLVYMTEYLFVLLLRKECRQFGITKTNKGQLTLQRIKPNRNIGYWRIPEEALPN